jgi:hypothetical protein
MEIGMATWKRVTDVDGRQMDVNTEQICFIIQHSDFTTLRFSGGGQSDEFLVWNVKEKMDDIHMEKPLRSI